MAVIEYEMPDSWNAKGMDWNSPDPRKADYVMAIRQALMERCAALHTSVDSRVLKISPYKTVSRTAVAGILDTISRLARNFVNLDWEEFEEDYSDFPKMWTYGDLVQERNCRLYEWIGNTHWKCPRPDYEGDPEYNKDGYCGYAMSQAYRVTIPACIYIAALRKMKDNEKFAGEEQTAK